MERDSRSQARLVPAAGSQKKTGEGEATLNAREASKAGVQSAGMRALSTRVQEGLQASGARDPWWWNPVVTRVPPQDHPTESLSAPEDGDVPTQDSLLGMKQTSSERSPVDRVLESEGQKTQKRERGELDGQEEDHATADASEADDGVVAVEEVQERDRVDRMEPLAEEQELTPPSQDAQVGSQGVAATQGGTSLAAFDAEEGGLAINAKKTERGVWITEVDRVVRASWRSQELPMALRGEQLRGDVSVRFAIGGSGRVDDVKVTRSSGNEWLDALAVAAIPKRVPKPPRSLGSEVTLHEIRFRYR